MGRQSFFGWVAVLILFSLSGCGDSKQPPLWTVLIYMAGDNNLSPSLSADLTEMEAVGSTMQINVVVQLDTLGGNARRLLVKKNGSTLLEDLGEQNMADPQTLQEFILWAKTRFPADRFALILSSHGDGLAKRIPDPPRDRDRWRILQDDTDGVPCCLTNVRVREALEAAGIYFDLLGLDASQMGQIETAYEFRNLADSLVFSQETGQSNGWDYTTLLQSLVSDPLMDGSTFARGIVESYRSYYENVYYPENPGTEQVLTISAIRLKGDLDNLVFRMEHLSNLLVEGLSDNVPDLQEILVNAIGTAREQTQELNPYTVPFTYVDFWDLMNNLNQNLMGFVDRTLLRDATTEIAMILSMKEDVVIAEYHGKDRAKANGLSITFFRLPEAKQYPSYFEITGLFDPAQGDGSQIQFFHDTQWDQLLQAYYQGAGLLE